MSKAQPLEVVSWAGLPSRATARFSFWRVPSREALSDLVPGVSREVDPAEEPPPARGPGDGRARKAGLTAHSHRSDGPRVASGFWGR
jgi:hypothetical protein